MSLDLFPETLAEQSANATPAEVTQWQGASLCKWGYPRIEARLIPVWNAANGWTVGWLAKAEQCLDEWPPSDPNGWRAHAIYPWYRLDEMPKSALRSVACGSAARGLRMVLEQFLASGYVPPELHVEVRAISDRIEAQAQAWLTGAASNR
jgi:hypothetical protein